jgi:predicted dehydrogenase
MKVLFVGLGSIGQRHLRNFIEISNDFDEIYAFRKTNNNLVIIDGDAKKVDSLEEFYGINCVTNLEEGLKIKPDIVFITNPSSLHLEIAIQAAKSNCNLFIEKPLSDSLKGIKKLKKIIEKKKLNAAVAYQTKYNPCFGVVKDIIDSKKYGNIKFANFEWGTFLPDHHPYEDFRKSYASRKDLGGGVILGLSHEIDLIRNFFGMPDNISITDCNFNQLDLDVEDTARIEMDYNQLNADFKVKLYLSYAQKNEERFFIIDFDLASLRCDLISNEIQISAKADKNPQIIAFPILNRNDLFLDELREFVKSVDNKEKNLKSFTDGIETLKLCINILEKINAKIIK